MNEVVKENPGRSDYIDTLAVLYRANGQNDLAQQLSKRAMVFAGADGYDLALWEYTEVPTIRQADGCLQFLQ